ncbi:glycosyltransferase family 2 protein [Lentzea sp. NPDC058436]|uniref:glycosyltransferase family 2 protein n=1 Tax=Lentzea sp. NPDC058436 TaxID=3346499 RepID=UPI0036672717
MNRNKVSATARKALRDAFGLWPLHEAKNNVVLGRHVGRLRRFEDDEVRRHGPTKPKALVATVIPTYKRPELLVDAVNSALAQTVTDQVVVVVDDGAGLPELPRDPRLHAVSLARNTAVLGLVRNVGIRLTDSKYIAFLDDDNTWREDHLELALAGLEKGPDVVYTAVERRRADGTVLDVLTREFDRVSFRDGTPYVDANSLVVRRSPDVIFSRLPRTKSTLPKEDWEFVHRLAKRHAVEHVPQPTVRYLVNEASYYTAWD